MTGEEAPGDTMRGRVPSRRGTVWLLLTADRRLLTGGVLLVVFLVILGLGGLAPGSLTGGDPVETLFQALLTAIITGVTLVVTINQLVLSQELGAVGDQRERMEGALAFRSDVADVLGRPASPAEPSAFLQALVSETGARAADLDASLDDDVDPETRDRLSTLSAELEEHAEEVATRLEGARFGTFAVLSAALDFNYSWKLHQVRAVRAEAGSTLPDATSAALADLETALALFGPAREHVKTLYFQWDLIDLSRRMLYAAVPALLTATGAILYLDAPPTAGGTLLGVPGVVWVVALATTVALLPFALLLAYILRIATIAKRTLAIGPFVLRETDRTDGGESD